MDQGCDERDHQEHDHRQVVDVHAQGKAERLARQGIIGWAGEWLAAEQHPIEARLPDVRAVSLMPAQGLARVLSEYAGLGLGMVLGPDPLGLEPVIIDETNQAEQK